MGDGGFRVVVGGWGSMARGLGLGLGVEMGLEEEVVVEDEILQEFYVIVGEHQLLFLTFINTSSPSPINSIYQFHQQQSFLHFLNKKLNLLNNKQSLLLLTIHTSLIFIGDNKRHSQPLNGLQKLIIKNSLLRQFKLIEQTANQSIDILMREGRIF